jgi:hypothetical protein
MASLHSPPVYSPKRAIRCPTVPFTTLEDDPHVTRASKLLPQLLVSVQTGAGDDEDQHADAPASRPFVIGPSRTDPSLDEFIRPQQQRPRDREPERLRGLKVDREFKPRGVLDREVTGPRTLEDILMSMSAAVARFCSSSSTYFRLGRRPTCL